MPTSVSTSEPIWPATASQSPPSQWAVTISSVRCMNVAGRAESTAETTMHRITSGSILG